MSRSDPADAARQALSQRLRAAAAVMLPAGATSASAVVDPATDAAEVFELLVRKIEDHPVDDHVWLLLTALSADFPTRGDIDRTRRRFQLDPPTKLRMFLLDGALQRIARAGTALAEIDLVVGGVIVDVDFTAKNDLHTGIQRVSRNLLPLWMADHAVVPAAWNPACGILRELHPTELDRVVKWGLPIATASLHDSETTDRRPRRMLVPWRSVVVMVEVPPPAGNDRLAALGSSSGNKLVGIAYDAIPIVSADTVPPVESMKFARYLTAVKFASRMAGISASATAEMDGFTAMLPTQGLVGPTVIQVSLPAASPRGQARKSPPGRPGAAPMVLVVGSHEPRKNHLAILHAAEGLWRTGLEFDLQFIGGSGWGEDFPRQAADMKAAGRPVEVRKGVSDGDLEQAMSDAVFTVFPSLHEGYGLPVAESMAHGTPVITSEHGSMAEIAADGGALMIDPRDDAALGRAMRLLLTNPDELVRLRRQILDRPQRGWADYAAELWQAIVAPELAGLTGTAGPTGTARPADEKDRTAMTAPAEGAH